MMKTVRSPHGASDQARTLTLSAPLLPTVHVVRVQNLEGRCHPGQAAPELRADSPATPILMGFRDLLRSAGLDETRYGTADWNPLGAVIHPGARVLLKPNWVRHPRPGHDDGGSLITSTDLIEAVLSYLEKIPDCRVVIGDAPIQGCDFQALLAAALA